MMLFYSQVLTCDMRHFHRSARLKDDTACAFLLESSFSIRGWHKSTGNNDVMTENILNSGSSLAELTGEIVSAYVTKNSVPAAELPKLIEGVYAALTTLQTGSSVPAPEKNLERPTMAQVRKSVQPDGLVSFIDGQSYKTLKRHLTKHGFDPRSYRERYGLPAAYPMVAQSYAERRSALAKAIGLGQPGAMAQTAPKKARRAA